MTKKDALENLIDLHRRLKNCIKKIDSDNYKDENLKFIDKSLQKIFLSIMFQVDETIVSLQPGKAYIKKLIEAFGEYKKVTDAETNISYKVPTRDIITKGLKQTELSKYPKWD